MDEQTANPESEQLYSVPQVAAKLGVHEFTIRRRIWGGHIRAIRIGPNRLRVPESELRRLTSAQPGAEPPR